MAAIVVGCLIVALAAAPATSAPPMRGRGYWVAGQNTQVFAFGDALLFGRADRRAVRGQIVDMAARASGRGYWLLGQDGGVYPYGDARDLGQGSFREQDAVAIAATPSGNGYFLAGEKGDVKAFGDAVARGALDNKRDLKKKIVDLAVTPSGGGYWLVDRAGVVYAFGDARLFGTLSRGDEDGDRDDVVGMAATPRGDGYWIASSRGDVYAFGAARGVSSIAEPSRHHGGEGDDDERDAKQDKKIVDITPTVTGGGFWLVDREGHVFAFGDATLYGQLGKRDLRSGQVVAIVSTPFVNHDPVAADDSAALDEDTTVDIAVLANDSDEDGDPLAIATLGAPSHGTTTQLPGNVIRYAPAPDYNGTDSFTYRVADGQGGFALGTVRLTIRPVNDAPVAPDDAFTADEDTPINAAVLANDTDVDGDTLAAQIVTAPLHGTLSPTPNGFTYTPDQDYNGDDSFTYRAFDGALTSGLAFVRLHLNPVNDAPVAGGDAYTTDEDATLDAPPPAVLSNDGDVDHDTLATVLVSGVAHGTLALAANGGFTYVPAPDYNGSDTFTYRASDGLLTSGTVTVTITINAVNDAPIASDDTYTADEDTPIVASVLSNDRDVDGDTLSAQIVAAPLHGTLTPTANGFRYVPDRDFNGDDLFTYRAFDGALTSGLATVRIHLDPVNDAPVAAPDAYATDEDTPLSAAAGVLSNDTDVDGDALATILVSGVAHGTLALAANGTFTYTPVANFNGSDSFTYRATDGLLSSDVVTVTITVRVVNDAPVANGDEFTIDEDSTLSALAPGLLANDSDVDGDALAAVLVTGPSHGTLSLGHDGGFTYNPAANYSGDDSFSYRADDGATTSGPATVMIHITAVNDAPFAGNDAFDTDEDMALTVGAPGVLSNDSDVDGPSMALTLLSSTSHGNLALNADGSFSYVPIANFFGVDSFSYKVSDGALDSGVATVTIAVNPVNDPPTGMPDAYSTLEDTELVVDATAGLLINDSDLDGDDLSVRLRDAPDHGALSLLPDGSFSYMPDPNYNGTDSFSYDVSDGRDVTTNVVVTLTIVSVDDPPTAADDSYSVAVGATLTIGAPGVLTNDFNDNGGLTAVLVTGVAHGTLTLNANGSFTYTTNLTSAGNDSFTYKVTDGTTDSAPATVHISVTGGGSTGGSGGTFGSFGAGTIGIYDTDRIKLSGTGTLGKTKLGRIVSTSTGVYYQPDRGARGHDSFTYGGRKYEVDVLSDIWGD